jgi:hypothetical protein
MPDAIKSFVAAQNIVNSETQLQKTHPDNEPRPTSGQTLAMRAMLRSLLGEIDFDGLCPRMKVGTIDEDVLQVFVPAENCAADIKFRHSDDFAVAAEYALGQPIRKVNILSTDLGGARGVQASCLIQTSLGRRSRREAASPSGRWGRLKRPQRSSCDEHADRVTYERAFDAMAKEGVDGLIISDAGEHITNRKLIVDLAAKPVNQVRTDTQSNDGEIDWIGISGDPASSRQRGD